MTFDEARRQVVMFGGRNSTGVFQNDTWLWDGTDWTSPTTSTPPTIRRGCAMAFDSVSQACLMFGGFDGVQTLGDTWLWNGSAWTQLAPAQSPQQREYHAMANDHIRGRVVLHGGFGPPGPWASQDTWEWDGITWAQRASAPVQRGQHAMYFDHNRGCCVCYGGKGSGDGGFPDTWEYDGSTWTQNMVPSPPAGRYQVALVFDAWRGQGLAFGGILNRFGAVHADTWTYSGPSPASFVRFGSACAGTGGVPRVDLVQLPTLGATYRLAFTGIVPQSLPLLCSGWSLATWALGSLPYPLVHLTPLAGPGCRLNVSPDVVGFAGSGSYALAIPNASAFLGAAIHHQVLQLEMSSGTPVAISASAGVRATVGTP